MHLFRWHSMQVSMWVLHFYSIVKSFFSRKSTFIVAFVSLSIPCHKKVWEIREIFSGWRLGGGLGAFGWGLASAVCRPMRSGLGWECGWSGRGISTSALGDHRSCRTAGSYRIARCRSGGFVPPCRYAVAFSA